MSIYLEFPSIEDYPVYSSAASTVADDSVIPALPFNWLRTLEFSATRFLNVDAVEVIQRQDEE